MKRLQATTHRLLGYAIDRTSIALAPLAVSLKQQRQFRLPRLMMPISLRLHHVMSQTLKPFSNIIHPHQTLFTRIMGYLLLTQPTVKKKYSG
jgi:hypothetical protein